MRSELDIQVATVEASVPDRALFELWVGRALQHLDESELTLRLVDEDESRALNSTYRGMDKPTNVLSFMADIPEGIDVPLLGDIVICAPLVRQEAAAQKKSLDAHWAHLVIHGVLHLLGHDHQDENEAGEMEAIEVELLASLGIANPYL